jgi:hypothetical protein
MRKRIGYRAPVRAPKHHQQPIAQCGQRVCGISLRRMPGIFTKGHISYMMDRVLDETITNRGLGLAARHRRQFRPESGH